LPLGANHYFAIGFQRELACFRKSSHPLAALFFPCADKYA
jgi:hypothetical protein